MLREVGAVTGFFHWINRMNLLFWIALSFVFHLVLYLTLGTDNWLFATVAATLTYTLLFAALKAWAQNRTRGGVR
jgi:heme O synthase-like polyprenyltransferase